MMRFLCRLGLHSWRKLPNTDNCFGMGLAYRPKAKSKPAKKRQRRARKAAKREA